MMAILSRFQQKLRKLDVSSSYAFYVGLGAITVSCIVTVVTFFKLWILEDTSLWISLLISIIVFYIFTELYTFLALWTLRFFENQENEL
ncbi:hypothetical protein KW782_02020 [Candidatus Parcubacteria bacterium]|nr:hypothetical protein [Candidatus Parcubacteria bacterium]